MLLCLLLLALAGCTAPGQGLAYVVNRTGEAAGQGKSYAYAKSQLTYKDQTINLTAAEDVQLVVETKTEPAQLLGQKINLSGGMLPQGPVSGGYLILQTLQNGVYRGNFNATLPNGLEAVGYFEATRQP